MNLCARILKWLGWTVTVSVPDYDKCLICVAPHTSNWDFLLGEVAIRSVGRSAGFLMKESWFFWPLGSIFRAMGGVPVPRRKKKGSLTEALVERFRECERLVLAITPEGTRSRNANWHTGFLHIAREAQVPILLAALDFGTKNISLVKEFRPSGDVEADMKAVKEYYRSFKGKYPEKFAIE